MVTCLLKGHSFKTSISEYMSVKTYDSPLRGGRTLQHSQDKDLQEQLASGAGAGSGCPLLLSGDGGGHCLHCARGSTIPRCPIGRGFAPPVEAAAKGIEGCTRTIATKRAEQAFMAKILLRSPWFASNDRARNRLYLLKSSTELEDVFAG